MSKPSSPRSEVPLLDSSSFRDLLLRTIEDGLSAQLKAVRRLRVNPSSDSPKRPDRKPRAKGRSQVDLAEDILKSAAGPLHVSEIIQRIHKTSGRLVDSESLVSALSKRVARNDRFRRTARNTFALI
jgi:hypothetical protein